MDLQNPLQMHLLEKYQKKLISQYKSDPLTAQKESTSKVNTNQYNRKKHISVQSTPKRIKKSPEKSISTKSNALVLTCTPFLPSDITSEEIEVQSTEENQNENVVEVTPDEFQPKKSKQRIEKKSGKRNQTDSEQKMSNDNRNDNKTFDVIEPISKEIKTKIENIEETMLKSRFIDKELVTDFSTRLDKINEKLNLFLSETNENKKSKEMGKSEENEEKNEEIRNRFIKVVFRLGNSIHGGIELNINKRTENMKTLCEKVARYLGIKCAILRRPKTGAKVVEINSLSDGDDLIVLDEIKENWFRERFG